MSTSRVRALAASFVWSVESTKWPVREAWIAISAVSLSRISPTGDVGVLPEDGAKARREGQLDLQVDLDLTDAVLGDLDRVLDRDDVLLGAVDRMQRGVERRRHAGPSDPSRGRCRSGVG